MLEQDLELAKVNRYCTLEGSDVTASENELVLAHKSRVKSVTCMELFWH